MIYDRVQLGNGGQGSLSDGGRVLYLSDEIEMVREGESRIMVDMG